MKRALGWLGVVAVVLLLVECLGIPVAQVPLWIVFGWIAFLGKTLPQMWVEPAAFAVSGAALVVGLGIFHALARWLYGQTPADPAAPPRRWRFRWSLSIVLLVVFLFAAGIAVVAAVHETGWLVASGQPWFASSGRGAARRAMSVNNLRQIGLGFHNYHDSHKCFPPGGTFNQYGEMRHSWETMLLPYLEHPDLPDMGLPWDHPANAAFFHRELEVFLNPGVQPPAHDRVGYTVDALGYGLSHYAANSRLFAANSRMRVEDVADGTTNTIMGGEVSAGFKPWGHPVNWRDPADGLGRSPDGFGGPWKSDFTNLLMADGSVRAVRNDIDPEVLKALATPAGGEKLPENWEGY